MKCSRSVLIPDVPYYPHGAFDDCIKSVQVYDPLVLYVGSDYMEIIGNVLTVVFCILCRKEGEVTFER